MLRKLSKPPAQLKSSADHSSTFWYKDDAFLIRFETYNTNKLLDEETVNRPFAYYLIPTNQRNRTSIMYNTHGVHNL
jgi:hypothetical protein